MKNLIFILTVMSLLLTGCFEKDERVPPYSGEVTTIEHNIGEYQSYFDLESNKIISYNAIDEWDLGFECGAYGWHIKVNSANQLFISQTAYSDIEENIVLTGNEIWKYDAANGDTDSTAFGSWCDTTVYPMASKNYVYLAGKNTGNGYFVVARIQMVEVDSNKYFFRYCLSGENNVRNAEIFKNDSVNYVYYNLQENIQKNLEPGKTAYDLIFTPYYDLAYYNGITLPYLVRGVFLNGFNVTACLETQLGFDEITRADITDFNFSAKQDVIGYDWKDVTVDFAGGTASYDVIPGRVYIIRSVEGNYYKLRFLSYTLDGINGFPRFEYKPVIQTK